MNQVSSVSIISFITNTSATPINHIPSDRLSILHFNPLYRLIPLIDRPYDKPIILHTNFYVKTNHLFIRPIIVHIPRKSGRSLVLVWNKKVHLILISLHTHTILLSLFMDEYCCIDC